MIYLLGEKKVFGKAVLFNFFFDLIEIIKNYDLD